MAFFTDVMTVYNYRQDADGEHWVRSVLRGVQWRHGRRRGIVDKGVFSDEPEESVTVDFRRVYTGNPSYLSPEEYRKAERAEGIWTLDPANGTDVIICGEIFREVGKDYSISQLKRDYAGFTVVSVADNRNRSRLKHIRVVAE